MLFVAFLASSPLGADYEIVLRGGAHYASRRKPAEKNGAYVFTATDGTLLSVRKSEVASIRVARAAKPETTPADLGATSSMAGAARSQREAAKRLRARPKTMPQNSDAYRPGVGVAPMPGSNDYVVGKTWAPPPGSTVYSGDAPQGVPSEPAPTGAPEESAPTAMQSGDAPTGVQSGDVPRAAEPPPPPPLS